MAFVARMTATEVKLRPLLWAAPSPRCCEVPPEIGIPSGDNQYRGARAGCQKNESDGEQVNQHERFLPVAALTLS